MEHYLSLHHPQHLNPFLPTTPPGHPPTHHSLPVAHQAHGQNGGFNTNWGPAQMQQMQQMQQLIYHLHQSADGGSSATEVAVPADNVGHRCQWLTGNMLCSQVFVSFDELMLHLARAHDVQGSAHRTVRCQWWANEGYCGREGRRDGMRRHIAKHLRCSVSCMECGKPFSRRDSMRTHMKKKHSQQ